MKPEEEKRLMRKLMRQTEKDGKECGVLIGGDKRLFLKGVEGEIAGEAMEEAVLMMFFNQKTDFTLYHTHDEWDSPLSWNDIIAFLIYKNLHEMVAVTSDHVYRVIKTMKTPLISYEKRDEIAIKLKKYAKENEGYQKSDDESYRKSLSNATKKLASEYKFIYIEEQLYN